MGIVAILLLVLAALVVVLIIALLKGIYIIHENELGIVERLGKYTGAPVGPGPNWRRVFFDKVAHLNMSTRNHSFEVNARTITDGVMVVVSIFIEFEVDPEKAYLAHYKMANPQARLQARATNAITTLLYTMALDDALVGMERIAAAVSADITNYAAENGYIITNVLVTQVVPELSVLTAMREQASLVRQQEIDDAKATAANNRKIATARADAEAARLAGQAKAADFTALNDAVQVAVGKLVGVTGVDSRAALATVVNIHTNATTGIFAANGSPSHVFIGGGSPELTSAAVTASANNK